METNTSANINIKYLIKLSIPIFLELILQVLLGNVDKVMVRNDFSANAINQANSIISMLTVSISVLSAGSLILINQYKGANDKISEQRIYSLAFFFNLFLSTVLGIIILFFSPYIFRLMNVSVDYFDEALIYIRLNGGFLFLQGIILTLSSFLRSNTLILHGFIASASINILNVILNALFMYVLNLQPILAVGLATVISRAIGVILLLILVFKLTNVKLSLKETFKNFKELKKLLKISLPSAGESFSYSLSQIVILSIINIIGIRLTSAAPTAKTYVNIMVQFSFIFTSSISQAMQILLGRLLGAKDTNNAEKLIYRTLNLSILSSVLISTIQALLSLFIFSFFTKDQEVIKLCSYIMWIEIALELGRAINITLVRALQTSGDVIFPTILAIIFCWVVAVVFSYIFGITFKLGIIGVWIAMSIDEIVRGIIFIIRLKQGNWKKRNLTNTELN